MRKEGISLALPMMVVLKKSFFIFSLFVLFSFGAFAQNIDSSNFALDTIYVSAFEQNRKIIEVPAAIQYISKQDIARFDNQDVSQVLNQYPGIRIEERSPGSYRIAIRGSSLRSPFGVRNVKVYWKNIPLTDATGNTYFNLQDINTIESLEVLKGPSGSMYGAGIGGVLLIEPKNASAKNGFTNEIQVNSLLGSYGTFNRSIALRHASERINSSISYNGSKTDGYRDHSNFTRESLQWQSTFFLNPNYSLSLFTQFTELDYQTPLGLTAKQAEDNPRQARPGNSFVGGAVEQGVGIKQRQLNLGLTQEWTISNRFKSSVSLFGNSSVLSNPFITNYEDRNQYTLGTRLVSSLDYGANQSKLNFGLEWQTTESLFEVFDNNGGDKGNFQFQEEVAATQGLFFIQNENPLPLDFLLTLGLSVNTQKYDYTRTNGTFEMQQEIIDNSSVPVIPRIGLSKKLGPLYAYGTYSRGFSPPTVAEFIDSFDPLNAGSPLLAAETADNVELGFKASFWQNKAYTEASIYRQSIQNAIVRGFNSQEDQIFTNEGGILQQGLESYSKVNLSKVFTASLSLNWTNYQFEDYIDDADNFSGNRVPSVPNFQGNFAIDAQLKSGFFVNTNSNYTSAIYLNNENTVSSDPFWLINVRAGYSKSWKKFKFKVFGGVNNLTDSFYGAGNDVNPFGNRFFNPTATRNFNTGFDLSFLF